MSKMTIIEGNSNDKDNVRIFMVKGEKGDTGNPTKLSQLENDTGFITSEEIDLNNYYTKNEINTKVEDLNNIIDEKADTTEIETAINNEITTRTNEETNLQTQITNEIDSRINGDSNLQNQINSLASGSPLVANSTSEMTDITKTYVNTTDGNWYYYDGSSWVVGGTYQSSAIDISITKSGIGAEAKATGKELYKLNKNLKFNYNWLNGNIDGQGNIVQSSAYSPNSRIVLSDIEQATEDLIIKLSDYSLYKFIIHTYDENGNYINNSGWSIQDYIIPLGTRFRIVLGMVQIDESSNHYSELVSSASIIPVSKYCEDDIKESLKAKYFSPQLEIGGLYQGNNAPSSNNERLRTTNHIWLNEGDIVAMLNPSIWFAVIGYDEFKRYNNYDSGWQTKQKFIIQNSGYYRCAFKVQNNSSFGTSNDIYKYEKFFIIYNSKGLNQKTFKKATENMHVVLHRGFSPLYPENTLIAFREGKIRGFEEIETDIWFSADNVPVLCHDPSINRTSNGTGNIADLTLAQLKSYDFGSWKGTEFTGIKIPTLEEAILDAKIHGYRLQLEPKESWTQAQAEIVVGIIQKYNMSKHVSFGGYDGYDLIKIHSLDDSIDLKRMCTEINQANIDATFSNSIKSDNNNTTLIIDYSNLTNEGLALAKTSNCPVHVYFANSIDRYEELCSKYIKEVTTDFINPIEFYNGTVIE